MSDTISSFLLTQVINYGAPLFGLTLFLGAMGLPLPGSLMVIAVGSFSQQGYFSSVQMAIVGLLGALLGDAISRLFIACGYNTIKSNLMNDRGIHICKAMYAWEKFGNGETPESVQIKGDHLVGKYYVIFEKKLKEEQDNFILSQGVNLSTMEDREKDKYIEDHFYPNSEYLKAAREMLQQFTKYHILNSTTPR